MDVFFDGNALELESVQTPTPARICEADELDISVGSTTLESKDTHLETAGELDDVFGGNALESAVGQTHPRKRKADELDSSDSCDSTANATVVPAEPIREGDIVMTPAKLPATRRNQKGPATHAATSVELDKMFMFATSNGQVL